MLFILKDQQRRETCIAYINGTAKKNGLWSVEVKPYVPNRSQSQNRMLWAWYEIIGKDIGYTKDQMHDVFRKHYLGENEVVSPVTGEVFSSLKSTTNLNRREFSEYLHKIEIFASGEGIILPRPDDYPLAMTGVDK